MTQLYSNASSRDSSSENLLPLLYQSEESYGWSVGMRVITHALLDQLPLADGPVLEVGCGAGTFAQEVAQHHRHRTIVGIDVHALAVMLADAKAGQVSFAQSSLLRLPFAQETFAAVVSLDAFDQRGIDLSTALSESWRVLQDGGHLLLRVSAFSFLESEHDRAFNTGRRYRQPELATALAANGFNVVRTTYANAILLLPVLAQRFLERNGVLEFQPNLYTDTVVNRLTESVLSQEARWLQHNDFPAGVSLYMIARKIKRS